MVAANAAATCAEAGEEFLGCARARDFGVGASDAGESVRVAAGDSDFSVRVGEPLGCFVGLRPHLAVARFEREGVRSEPLEVFELAAAGESGKNVIHAVENFTLGEVHQEHYKIVTTLLNFEVVPFGDAVDAEVEFGGAGQGAGYFFAEEKVRVIAEDLRGVDGIMVGDGDDGHAEAFAAVVDGFGVVVGLAAKVADECCVAHPGGFGVDVKVALHGEIIALGYEQSVKRLRNVGKCVYVTY